MNPVAIYTDKLRFFVRENPPQQSDRSHTHITNGPLPKRHMHKYAYIRIKYCDLCVTSAFLSPYNGSDNKRLHFSGRWQRVQRTYIRARLLPRGGFEREISIGIIYIYVYSLSNQYLLLLLLLTFFRRFRRIFNIYNIIYDRAAWRHIVPRDNKRSRNLTVTTGPPLWGPNTLKVSVGPSAGAYYYYYYNNQNTHFFTRIIYWGRPSRIHIITWIHWNVYIIPPPTS